MRLVNLLSVFLSTCVAKARALFFTPTTTTTSLTQEHLKAAKLCRDVYSDAIEKSDTFVESADTGAQATVSLDGTKAIVCFRGSNCLNDWRHNLSLSRVPFLSRKHSKPGLEVHSGFFIAHNSVKAKIYAKLNDIINAGKCESVLFAGHSAGATLAAICAFDFQNEKNLELEVVSLGSPKVGNAAFATEFNAQIRCTRIVNDNDGIPLAPLFGGYHHVGDEVIRLREFPPETCTEEKDDAQSLFSIFIRATRLEFIADHDIDAYVTTIEKSLKKET